MLAVSSAVASMLALLEHCLHRRIADDADERRIADLARTARREAGALAGIGEVGLDAGEQIARDPIVAGLGAADCTVEPVRTHSRQQRTCAGNVAEHGVGMGRAPAAGAPSKASNRHPRR
jgi:hypothetical protein